MSFDIKIVSIIGAGFLGKQIASQTAFFDYTVCITPSRFDLDSEILEKIVKKIIRKKKQKGALGEVTCHNKLAEAVMDADLIIESVPERLDLKKEKFFSN